MEKKMLDILMDRNFYPCKIKKEEGIILKKIFTIDEKFLKSREEREHLDDLEFRYSFSEEGKTYVLLEEYLFKENTTILDVNTAIGVNYYLNKK